MKRMIYVILGCLALMTTAWAASFDCAKAKTRVEKIICEDAALSKLDEEMNVAYKTALQDEKQANAIKQAQKQWMKERNDCSDAECVRSAYENRNEQLRAMSSALSQSVNVLTTQRCSKPGVDFEIENQQVTGFYAQSSASDPDLANGYTLTCVQHIGKFSQSRNDNEYVLSFNESNDQYGESKLCKVHITDEGEKYHLYTTDCVSECMKFNYQIKKVGKDCRVAK